MRALDLSLTSACNYLCHHPRIAWPLLGALIVILVFALENPR